MRRGEMKSWFGLVGSDVNDSILFAMDKLAIARVTKLAGRILDRLPFYLGEGEVRYYACIEGRTVDGQSFSGESREGEDT